MRINVCCGRHVLEGWTNVDLIASDHPKAKGRVPDILADMSDIPLPDGCADELLCVHGVEHVYPWVLDRALREWLRLLKPGGLIAIETPDLLKCCQNVLEDYKLPKKHPDQMGVFGLYGDYTLEDEFMMHKFLYSPRSLREKLEHIGYVDIREEVPQWHGAGRDRRDLRMVAYKPPTKKY